MAGLGERAVYNFGQATTASFGAHVGDGVRNRRLEAWPVIAAQDPQVARRFVPFDNETCVGSGAKFALPPSSPA